MKVFGISWLVSLEEILGSGAVFWTLEADMHFKWDPKWLKIAKTTYPKIPEIPQNQRFSILWIKISLAKLNKYTQNVRVEKKHVFWVNLSDKHARIPRRNCVNHLCHTDPRGYWALFAQKTFIMWKSSIWSASVFQKNTDKTWNFNN